MRIIAAPSNLGLRPLWPGHESGAWRSPEVLLEAGLGEALGGPPVLALARPGYSPLRQPGTGLLNGHAARELNLALADVVEQALEAGEFPLVLGGDCSVLLGALAGARRSGPVSLVHVDGHSDFRHPGNYDHEGTLGAIAGMDLALATGRGEAIMTQWPGIEGPLVLDEDVVQLGEREGRDADFAWPDVTSTAITQIDVFEARAAGAEVVVERIRSFLDRKPSQRFWLHFDVDVFDRSVMPAVDSPGSPGIEPSELARILDAVVAEGRCCGMTVTVYDPDLDPDGHCARLIVGLLGALPFRRRPREAAISEFSGAD